MEAKRQLEVLISTMPHLYEGAVGNYGTTFKFGGVSLTRRSFSALTPETKEYIEECIKLLNDMKANYSLHTTEHEENRLKEFFASIWLSKRTDLSESEWFRVFDYFYSLGRRTNENNYVHKNIKIRLDHKGPTTKISILDHNNDKFLDLLGSGQLTSIVTDRHLNIIETDTVDVSLDKKPKDYVFYPDFIGELIRSCKEREILITSTTRGDLFVCYDRRMIASKRRDHWTIYDAETFKNTITEISGDYRLGCNLYGILLDLSYKRHGGLIIVDDRKNFKSYTNIADAQHDSLKPKVSLNNVDFSSQQKKELAEFTSIDGAILIDKASGNVQSFGRIITTHPKCKASYGARSTAAMSAALNGATAFKVSSDGDVTIFFKTKSTGDEILQITYL